MSVRILGLAGIALAISAGCALRALDPARRPENVAAVLAKSNDPKDLTQTVEKSAQAVRVDSANPYRWAAYGEALAQLKRVREARRVFRRAVALAPDVPQIWFHDASFHFNVNEKLLGLHCAARILEQVSDYDAVFFNYFDQLGVSPSEVLPVIERNRRASRSYTEHLITIGNVEGAQLAWQSLLSRGFLDNQLTALYISSLLRNRRFEAARRDWVASQAQSDYAEGNLIFNGDFEREPTGCPLDWVIHSSDQVDTSRDRSVARQGRWSLKIHFHGDSNLSYENVSQTILVNPGRYHLQSWLRTDGITTDEGIGIEVVDAENSANFMSKTRSLTGTNDWTPIDATFTVPESSHVVSVRVVRSPSLKFDNAIAGTGWLDSVSLRRIL